MRARLGFSVAFHTDPDILLIDEVLGVGDEDFRKKSATAIREKIRSNKTVILVSHAPQMIRQLCDRAVWIEKGVVQMVGEAGKVLEAYLSNVPKAHPSSV
jgi:lipopolysaccharide transport system ATP-binding protein